MTKIATFVKLINSGKYTVQVSQTSEYPLVITSATALLGSAPIYSAAYAESDLFDGTREIIRTEIIACHPAIKAAAHAMALQYHRAAMAALPL